MSNEDYSLDALEQKVPHIDFLVRLFMDDERYYYWNAERKARFQKVKDIMLKCWDEAQAQARQMMGNAAFQSMFATLKRAMEALTGLQAHVDRVRTAAPLFQQMSLRGWDDLEGRAKPC